MDKIAYVLDRFETAKSKRTPFDGDWNSIRDFVRPISVAFNQTTGQFTAVRPETMFDGTAGDALEELASALHSYLTNPAERWFELNVQGRIKTQMDFDELAWLEEATDCIIAQYQREDSSLNSALHETYLDLGSFGAGVLSQEWDKENRGLIFQAKPLAHCYILENSRGQVDTLFHQLTWSLRQVKQEFGNMLPPKMMQINGEDKPIEMLHCVYPGRITSLAPIQCVRNTHRCGFRSPPRRLCLNRDMTPFHIMFRVGRSSLVSSTVGVPRASVCLTSRC